MNWFLLVLSKYTVFTGRARRSEYWYFILISTIISFILAIIGNLIDFKLLGTLYSLAVLLPTIGVAIRRMHDIGKSGWYCLIPIYNIILAATEGDRGENTYGTDPKEIVY